MNGLWIRTSTEAEMRRGTASAWTSKVRLSGGEKEDEGGLCGLLRCCMGSRAVTLKVGVVYLGTDPEAKEVYPETVGLKICFPARLYVCLCHETSYLFLTFSF